MTTEADIVAALEGYGPLAALVGSRVYPLAIPESVTDSPALAYQQIAARRFLALDDGIDGKERTLYQFSSWHRTQETAIDVSREVGNALRAASFTAIFDSRHILYDEKTREYGAVLSVIVY